MYVCQCSTLGTCTICLGDYPAQPYTAQMAKRAAVTRTKTGTEIVVLQGGGGAVAPRRRSGGGGRRRSRKRGRRIGVGKGGNIQTRLQKVALGGLAYGLAIKHFGAQLPRLPGIGRSGTIALAIYLLKPSNQLLQDMGVAAAAIAGASFGETGTVSGEDEVLTND